MCAVWVSAAHKTKQATTKHLALLASFGKLGLSEHMLLWLEVDRRWICGGRGAGAGARSKEGAKHASGAGAHVLACSRKRFTRRRVASRYQRRLMFFRVTTSSLQQLLNVTAFVCPSVEAPRRWRPVGAL